MGFAEPLAGSDGLVCTWDVPQKAEQQSQGVLSYGIAVAFRGVKNLDAALLGGLKVDVLQSGTTPGDELELGKGVHNLRSQQNTGANNHAMHMLQFSLQNFAEAAFCRILTPIPFFRKPLPKNGVHRVQKSNNHPCR
jgi:hypothetical protein